VSPSELLASQQRALSVTQRALSITQRDISVTPRALSITQRATSVTPRALTRPLGVWGQAAADVELLRARSLRASEALLARVRATASTHELRTAGRLLAAAASRDGLCAMTVQASQQHNSCDPEA
jgi:hypothetical protein